jgi:hypothetical protein
MIKILFLSILFALECNAVAQVEGYSFYADCPYETQIIAFSDYEKVVPSHFIKMDKSGHYFLHGKVTEDAILKIKSVTGQLLKIMVLESKEIQNIDLMGYTEGKWRAVLMVNGKELEIGVY